MNNRLIIAADLFAGAGGSSSGLTAACKSLGYDLRLTAINHWDVAIATHSVNHPFAKHLCESLDSVRPQVVIPDGKLSLLLASPECIHHSWARGTKPMSDQSRSSAWHILRWCEALRIDNLLMENVKEFKDWGPLGANGRPIKKRAGETYRAFLAALQSLGYNVGDRIVNAANHGDATTRERLFIQARRGRRPIVWPEPSHTPAGSSLFGSTALWRTAREIIDWDLPLESVGSRKKSLAESTTIRIATGVNKFGQVPFFIQYNGASGPQSIDEPLNTLTTKDRFALVVPSGNNIPDFGFRMLEVHEMAAAMGFPADYRFGGNRGEQVKMIGNAVCVNTSRALCQAILEAA